jgi:hypothetical protein
MGVVKLIRGVVKSETGQILAEEAKFDLQEIGDPQGGPVDRYGTLILPLGNPYLTAGVCYHLLGESGGAVKILITDHKTGWSNIVDEMAETYLFQVA